MGGGGAGLIQASTSARARLAVVPCAQELQRAVATLAFRAHTTCARYAELFADSQWDELVGLFLQVCVGIEKHVVSYTC